MNYKIQIGYMFSHAAIGESCPWMTLDALVMDAIRRGVLPEEIKITVEPKEK